MGRADDAGRLFLVDGTAQLFRAYFAIGGLSNDEGLPTGAVYGFTAMLRKLLVDESPEFVAVAFDLPGEVFRHDEYADYKANRPPAPEDLNLQMPYAKQACEVLGVRVVEQAGYEADDLIATYAKLARAAGREVVVVASDKDLLQLVGEGTQVFNPSKELWLDADGVTEQFGVPPERVIDVLGLMGDSVDNIPGVPGVGQKTALMAVSTYGDVEAVIARGQRFAAAYDARDELLAAIDALAKAPQAADDELAAIDRAAAVLRDALDALVEVERDDELAARFREARTALDDEAVTSVGSRAGEKGRAAARTLAPLKKLLKSLDRGSSKRVWYAVREHAEQARLSRRLATLHDDVPLEHPPEALAVRGPAAREAAELFRALGFRTLTEEFDELVSREGGEAVDDVPDDAASWETVLDAARLEQIVAACRRAGRFAVDTETDSVDPMRARLVGISLAWASGHGAYIPIGHRYVGVPDQLALDTVRERLGPLLAEPAVGKLAQNLKYDAHVLRRHGMPVEGWALDTMVAAFLLNASRSSYGMDSLAAEYLGHTTIPYSSLVGSGAKRITLDVVEVDRVAEYAAEDAEVTLRLADTLEPRLEQAGLTELYRTIDGPLLPVLTRMEAHGIRVDPEVLRTMSTEMATRIDELRGEIHEAAGVEFNVDSPKQLREVLFDSLGLKPTKKTAKSKAASTDAETLESLRDAHPIAGLLLEYRELTKLRSTYVDALPELINPDTKRVHTSYHPTGAATGRLSSSDPNLQNIPVRTEAGRRIRAAFVAERGWRFISSDYSQVELRVLAHLASDPGLIEAFAAGQDIHRHTASKIFEVEPAEVTDEMRRRAKAINFGILYGMSETRLAREQGIPRGDARRFIAAYFERFSSVRDYIDEVRDRVRQDGAVRTLFGRLRPFPQLRQKVNRGVQEQALRAAVNTTIQGTAADLMKMAMLKVERALDEAGLEARMLLQVHDELLIEARAGAVDEVRARTREAMEGVHPLAVPLLVEQKVGKSWYDLG